MKLPAGRHAATLIIAVLAVALATGWLPGAASTSGHVSHAEDSRNVAVSGGHYLLSADAADGRAQSAPPAAALQSASGAAPVAVTPSLWGARSAGPKSTPIGLLLPPLRI